VFGRRLATDPDQAEAPGRSRRSRWRRRVLAIFSLLVFAVSARLLFVAFRTLNRAAVADAVLGWRERFPFAILLCGLSFLVVGVIEWRAMRWAGARTPFGLALRVSFIANGFAHSLGATALVAGAVRARLYARHGVDVTTAAAATVYQLSTSAAGFAALAGAALLATPGGGGATRVIGGLMMGALALYLMLCALARGSARLFSRTLALPSLKDALAQIGLGVLDNGLAMSILWMLLPAGRIAYPHFVAAYVAAYVGGALSGVPGGLGPFEGVLSRLLGAVDKPGLAAAFLGFRLIFYLLPLVLAACLYARELVAERGARRTPASCARP
jgi:uncharacterized membrane protein YbhN (UPF0104 family)